MAAGKITSQRLNLGFALSAALHLALLAALAFIFRHPLTTQIVAAGEGEGSQSSVIEVGVVEAGQLGFTKPRSVSYVGQEEAAINNTVVETAPPKPETNAEVLPTTAKSPKPKEKLEDTERPTARQTEQLITKQPQQGRSPDKNIEVGRTFGSSAPAVSGGVGVGRASGGAGASGVPGGSEYGRRIQMILSRNYNPPGGYEGAEQYVIVQLRIARDGRILSLAGGRVAPSYIKRRSTIEQVNYAAERAIIAANPLPPFPNGFLLGAEEAVAEIWFRYPK